ncbi:MAG: anti-sigma factor antagonist [Firmicutes bacterium]|nr:anti-sigma factor antagonist [Bacillota bacterium]
MEVALLRAGSTLIVRMKGDLDHHAADKLRAGIDDKLKRGGIQAVLFDFGGVNFMDSSGVGMLLGRYKIMTEKGGKVLACSLNPRIMRIFTMAGLQKKIPVFSSREDALAGAEGGCRCQTT